MSIDQEIIEIQELIEKKSNEVEDHLKTEYYLQQQRGKLYSEITELQKKQNELTNKL